MQGMAEEEVTDEEATGIGRQASAGGCVCVGRGGMLGREGGDICNKSQREQEVPRCSVVTDGRT